MIAFIPLHIQFHFTMKLTDNEIRDINRYLEEGKPLPENYRFLLFEDKREVELIWNGKTNEVYNVVLPFQVIEQVDEPRPEKNVNFQKTLFDIELRYADCVNTKITFKPLCSLFLIQIASWP